MYERCGYAAIDFLKFPGFGAKKADETTLTASNVPELYTSCGTFGLFKSNATLSDVPNEWEVPCGDDLVLKDGMCVSVIAVSTQHESSNKVEGTEEASDRLQGDNTQSNDTQSDNSQDDDTNINKIDCVATYEWSDCKCTINSTTNNNGDVEDRYDGTASRTQTQTILVHPQNGGRECDAPAEPEECIPSRACPRDCKLEETTECTFSGAFFTDSVCSRSNAIVAKRIPVIQDGDNSLPATGRIYDTHFLDGYYEVVNELRTGFQGEPLTKNVLKQNHNLKDTKTCFEVASESPSTECAMDICLSADTMNCQDVAYPLEGLTGNNGSTSMDCSTHLLNLGTNFTSPKHFAELCRMTLQEVEDATQDETQYSVQHKRNKSDDRWVIQNPDSILLEKKISEICPGTCLEYGAAPRTIQSCKDIVDNNFERDPWSYMLSDSVKTYRYNDTSFDDECLTRQEVTKTAGKQPNEWPPTGTCKFDNCINGQGQRELTKIVSCPENVIMTEPCDSVNCVDCGTQATHAECESVTPATFVGCKPTSCNNGKEFPYYNHVLENNSWSLQGDMHITGAYFVNEGKTNIIGFDYSHVNSNFRFGDNLQACGNLKVNNDYFSEYMKVEKNTNHNRNYANSETNFFCVNQNCHSSGSDSSTCYSESSNESTCTNFENDGGNRDDTWRQCRQDFENETHTLFFDVKSQRG